jgi:sarcosine oxidase subunit delta
MLLIRCPYCEMDRPELEFRYAGEAHVTRPPTRWRWMMPPGRLSLFPQQSARPACRALAPHPRLRPVLQRLRDTVSDRILTTYKAGEPRPAPAPHAGRCAGGAA